MKKVVSILLSLSLVFCSASVSFADSVIDTIMTAGTTQAFTAAPVSEDDLTTILQAGLAAASAINQQPWFFVAVTDQQVMAQISGGSFGAPAGGMPAEVPGGVDDGNIPAGMPEGAPAGFEGTPADGTFPAGMPEGAPVGLEGAPAGGKPAGMPASSGAKASLGDSPAAIIIYMDEATKSPNASFDCGLAAQNMYIAAASLGYGVKIVSSPTMTLNGANHDALCAQLGVDPSMQAVAVLLIGCPDPDTDTTSGATTRSEFAEKVSMIQ